MITLKTLEWDRCFSYGDGNKLILDNSPVTQIVGLNGHGKSSIPLIIEELFYNKNSKGMKKASIPNRHLSQGYRIYGAFEIDNDKYEIEVTRKAASKVVLKRNGEDISSHTATNTYKTVEELFGMDFKTFSQLIYQNTSSSLQFLTATDTNRKKFLIDLLHLTEYTALFEVFKNASKDSSSRLTALNSRLQTVQNWLDNNKLEDTTPEPLQEIEISTDEEAEEAALLSEEIRNISQKNKKIEQNNQYKKLLANIDINEINAIPVSEKQSYDSLQTEAGKLNHIITHSTREFKRIKDLGDSCPTCLQDIPSSLRTELLEREKAKVVESKQSLQQVNEAIEQIKQNNALFSKKMKAQKDWEDLWNSIDKDLPSNTIDREELESKLSIVQKRLSEKKSEISQIIKDNERRAKKNTRIVVILEQTEKFTKDLETISAELEEEREINGRLEVLKKSFSTNGLLAYKIENLVKELESLTNTYLAEFSDGRFTLEFAIMNDKLNVIITDNGNEVEIESLSSGELARVNTASLLAIRRLMSGISKTRINILFLDEVISTLDDYGKEKLVEVLTQEEGLNTFLVSHGWSHPLLTKLSVAKENNISRIE